MLAFAAAAGAAAGPPPPPPGAKGFELVLGTNRTIGAGGQHFHPLPPGKKRVCILDFDDTIKVGAGDVAADAQAMMDRCLAMGYEAKSDPAHERRRCSLRTTISYCQLAAAAPRAAGDSYGWVPHPICERLLKDDGPPSVDGCGLLPLCLIAADNEVAVGGTATPPVDAHLLVSADELLSSPAFQDCQPMKTTSLTKVVNYYGISAAPGCGILRVPPTFSRRDSGLAQAVQTMGHDLLPRVARRFDNDLPNKRYADAVGNGFVLARCRTRRCTPPHPGRAPPPAALLACPNLLLACYAGAACVYKGKEKEKKTACGVRLP